MKKMEPIRRSNRQVKQPDKCPSNDLSVSEPDLNSNLRGKKRKICNSAEMKPVRPKVQKQTVEGRRIDMYCWICHKQGQELLCNSCPRVFHENCINRNKCKFSDSGCCFECHSPSLIKDIQVQPIKCQQLRSLLKFAIQEALKDEVSKKNLPRNQSHRLENPKFCQYFKTWVTEPNNDMLCHIIDLDILIDKTNDLFPYLSCAAFFSDVKWMYHNSYALYGPDSEITETALKLEKNFKQQLLDIEGCPECYYLKHSEEYKNMNSFIKVCKNTHEVVWAKLRGSPYWPAKLLRIYNGHCDVRFFATHDKSVVPISLCYKISEQSPNSREIKQAKYKEACKEMSAYLTSYREIVADFAYSSLCTPLNGSIKGKKPKRDHCRRKAISETDVPKDPELIEASKGNKMPCPTNLILPNSSDIAMNENYGTNCSEKDQVCMDFVADDDVVVPSESSRLIDPPTSAFSHLVSSVASTSHELVSGAATNIPMASTSNEAINSNEVFPFVNTRASVELPVITSAISEEREDISSLLSKLDELKSDEFTMQNIFSFFLHSKSPSSDDDVVVLHEKKVPSNTVNEILQNPTLKYSLCQVLSSNRPHLQEILKQCLDFGVTAYLKLWLSSVSGENIETITRTYFNLFTKLIKTYNTLKERLLYMFNANKKLQAENEMLKKECQNTKEKYNIAMDRQNNAKKIIDVLLQKAEKNNSFTEHKNEENKFEELEAEVQNLRVALDRKIYELNQRDVQHELDLQRIEHLENVLTSNEKTYSTVGVQTLPNNQEDMNVYELVAQENKNLNQESNYACSKYKETQKCTSSKITENESYSALVNIEDLSDILNTDDSSLNDDTGSMVESSSP